MNKDTVIAVISDLHVGGRTSICPMKWNSLDGDPHRASPAQRIIHRQWINCAEQVRDCLTETKERKRLVLVINGDVIDGDHHDSHQLITRIKQEQINMASDLIDEWVRVAGYDPDRDDCIYLVRGTDAHEKGDSLEQIGKDIDGVIPFRKPSSEDSSDGRYSHNLLRKTVNGVYFRLTHHGLSTGRLPWTSEDSIRRKLKAMYFDCLDRKKPIPNYVIGAHIHQYRIAYYYGRNQSMCGVTSPSWQMRTHHGNRVAALDDHNDIGMIWFDVMANGNSREFHDILELEDVKISEF